MKRMVLSAAVLVVLSILLTRASHAGGAGGGRGEGHGPTTVSRRRRTMISPDNRRMVQVLGSESQAFLYDRTASPPTFLKFLGEGATKVRFLGGTGGAPLQVLVEFEDDTFSLYDENGVSKSAGVKSKEAKSESSAT